MELFKDWKTQGLKGEMTTSLGPITCFVSWLKWFESFCFLCFQLQVWVYQGGRRRSHTCVSVRTGNVHKVNGFNAGCVTTWLQRGISISIRFLLVLHFIWVEPKLGGGGGGKRWIQQQRLNQGIYCCYRRFIVWRRDKNREVRFDVSGHRTSHVQYAARVVRRAAYGWANTW